MVKIGISTGYAQDQIKLSSGYVSAVVASGGVPFLLPVTAEASLLPVYLQFLDGLLLTGGGDIDPRHYHQPPHCKLGEVTPVRDQMELQLTLQFYHHKKPILGICRGCQVLNVALGGTLFQDISSVTSQQHMQQAPREHPSHLVQIVEDSLLYSILGCHQAWVNSFHHQAVRDLPKGLAVVAFAQDGIVEAIEGTNGCFVLGVQWHPECMLHSPETKALFDAFVEACRLETGSCKIKGQNEDL